MDPDTDDGQLVYEITTEPKHGFLESKLKPGNPITTFTQGTEVLTFSGSQVILKLMAPLLLSPLFFLS